MYENKAGGASFVKESDIEDNFIAKLQELKYEEIYLNEYKNIKVLYCAIEKYINS